jgi:acetolactate synthase-1/2/3 large subunit/5-guanidino-2-oxopentanoate decarboxylase
VPIAALEGDAVAPTSKQAAATKVTTTPPDAEIDALLAKAKRAIIVFGGGASHAASHAHEFAARLGAGMFMTYAGRGIVPMSYPLNFGATLARAETAQTFAAADLVIAIGTELSECDIWRDHLGHDCPVIRVDIDPVPLRDAQDNTRAVLMDAEIFLQTYMPPATDTPNSKWNAPDVTAARTRWRAQTDAERPGIVPLCDALREATPEDTMFYSDMTQFAYVAKEVVPMSRPGHWHHPYGFGTLGYALPAAIGGAVARKGKPTIAIAGDYGFQYTLQELATAVELNLPLPIILWDNGKLGEIEDSMIRAQIAPNAVIQQNPDFCKLAEAYGANATAPRSIKAFKQAITEALRADRPTLIHITPETNS